MAHSTVLFDLDETLCEYRDSGAERLAAAFEETGVDPFFAIEAYYDISERYMDDARRKAERRARCFEDIAEAHGRDPAVGRRVAEAYADRVDHGNVQPLPGVERVLEQFADDYRVGIVTNGEPEMQDPKLDAIGAWQFVETVVYAGIETRAKPDPEPIEVALADLDSDPGEAAMVGNSLSSDVPVAHSAGVTSVWLNYDGVDDPEPEPDYAIDCMAELLEEPWR